MSDNGTKVYIYIIAGRIQEIQQLEWLGSLISTFHQVWFLFYFIFNESPFAQQLVSTVSVSIIKCSRPSFQIPSQSLLNVYSTKSWMSFSLKMASYNDIATTYL